jgi:hypothetical protein
MMYYTDAMVLHAEHLGRYRELAQILKEEALKEMRARKKGVELDFSGTEQAYNELMSAYNMTAFEDRCVFVRVSLRVCLRERVCV